MFRVDRLDYLLMSNQHPSMVHADVNGRETTPTVADFVNDLGRKSIVRLVAIWADISSRQQALLSLYSRVHHHESM
jgi:hypothetical protein